MWSVYLHHPEIFENSSSTKDFLKFVCDFIIQLPRSPLRVLPYNLLLITAYI